MSIHSIVHSLTVIHLLLMHPEVDFCHPFTVASFINQYTKGAGLRPENDAAAGLDTRGRSQHADPWRSWLCWVERKTASSDYSFSLHPAYRVKLRSEEGLACSGSLKDRRGGSRGLSTVLEAGAGGWGLCKMWVTRAPGTRASQTQGVREGAPVVGSPGKGQESESLSARPRAPHRPWGWRCTGRPGWGDASPPRPPLPPQSSSVLPTRGAPERRATAFPLQFTR